MRVTYKCIKRLQRKLTFVMNKTNIVASFQLENTRRKETQMLMDVKINPAERFSSLTL